MADHLLAPPRKIFCLSLHKTGTTSFHHFMEANGIASIHGAKLLNGVNYRPLIKAAKDDIDRVSEVLEPFFERYEAFSDTPYNIMYPQMIKKYPSAHFILITRNLESWWRSIYGHWILDVLDHHLTVLEYIQYSPYIADCSKVFTDRNRDEIIGAHRQHIEQVTAALSGHHFLHVELEDADLNTKIAVFLGLDEAKSYPHARKSRSSRDPKRIWKNIRLRLRLKG